VAAGTKPRKARLVSQPGALRVADDEVYQATWQAMHLSILLSVYPVNNAD